MRLESVGVPFVCCNECELNHQGDKPPSGWLTVKKHLAWTSLLDPQYVISDFCSRAHWESYWRDKIGLTDLSEVEKHTTVAP